MTDIRCQSCNKLLARAWHCKGEIKCTRCNKLNEVEVLEMTVEIKLPQGIYEVNGPIPLDNFTRIVGTTNK